MAGPRTVVDTSALLEAPGLPPVEELAVPEAVVDEFRNRGRSRRRLDEALAAGLAVMRPGEAARARVRAAAARTGDLPAMSKADLDVLALAVELGGAAWSDDYRIQNVGRALGVEVRGAAARGITEAWTWVPRCTGCRRILDAMRDECPVCGSPVRLVRKK